jgi:hypothetical protein
MRVRVCFLVPGVRTRPKPPDTSLGESRGHAPRRRVATSLFNGVRPPTTRRGQGERHSLIKLRERTDCPQLTDVPSDLRVNGARHASRDLMPPSKPISPPQGESLSALNAPSNAHIHFTRKVSVRLKRGGLVRLKHGRLVRLKLDTTAHERLSRSRMQRHPRGCLEKSEDSPRRADRASGPSHANVDDGSRRTRGHAPQRRFCSDQDR